MSGNTKKLKIYTDGASRGNPGDAAWAFLILDESGDPIVKRSGYIGQTTNNQAEYYAVIRALQRAREFPSERIRLHSDSQLLVKQVTGQWKVKDPELKRLHGRVKREAKGAAKVNFEHVPRDNRYVSQADQLCNDRLDEIQDK